MHFLLKWSIAALLSGNGADAVTSWGRPELNPVLGSQFGKHSAAIKFGAVGGAVAAEVILLRHHPELEKTFAITNLAGAGVLGGVAIRNWRGR